MGENLAWDYGPEEKIDPNTFMPMDTSDDFGTYEDNKFKCSNCVQCGDDEDDDTLPCCGCVNLNIMFPNYSDMPKCDACNPTDNSDGSWPGVGIRLTERDEKDLNEAVGLDADGLAHPGERRPGVATMSAKKVTACVAPGGISRFWVNDPYWYPAFPANPDNPWDGIQQGRWDAISKYWGNTSISCSNWSTAGLTSHDTAWVNGPNGLEEVRDVYQSTLVHACTAETLANVP